MKFKSMPVEEIRRLIETEENVLHPRMKLHLDRWRDCPACGGVFAPSADGTKTRFKCVSCGCTVDPDTGLMIDLGKPEKTREVIEVIPPGEERGGPA